MSFPRERLHREVDVGVDKWKAVKLVESAYSLQVRDFVFVNIDTEEKLCIVLLASDSIHWFIPFEKPADQATIIQKHTGQAHDSNKIILPNT